MAKKQEKNGSEDSRKLRRKKPENSEETAEETEAETGRTCEREPKTDRGEAETEKKSFFKEEGKER